MREIWDQEGDYLNKCLSKVQDRRDDYSTEIEAILFVDIRPLKL